MFPAGAGVILSPNFLKSSKASVPCGCRGTLFQFIYIQRTQKIHLDEIRKVIEIKNQILQVKFFPNMTGEYVSRIEKKAVEKQREKFEQG